MKENDSRYRLVFSGHVRAGFDRDVVIAGLEQLLRVNARQVERLLSGKKQHIRKPMGYKEAKIMLQQVHDIGAECKLKPIVDDSNAPFPPPDSNTP